MSNAAFRVNFRALVDKVGDKMELFVKASALGIGKSLVEKSPVDTGRFKGNWQYGQSSVNMTTSSAPSRDGSAAIGRIQTGLETYKLGKMIYITNSMPYAKKLEDGSSKQAPNGMVALTVQSFQDNVRKAAKSIR